MTTTRFIGDVHGKYGPYKKIIAQRAGTIQVGDMGVGFRRIGGYRDGEWAQNPPHYAMLAGNHRFIRGNHDNPERCRAHSQFIPDGTVDKGVMFVGGGVSVDRAMRIEGYSWWKDEELSQKEADQMMTVFEYEKPRVMVTHDCPESVALELARLSMRVNKLDPQHSSINRQLFEAMWQKSPPQLWIFGHWHYSFDQVVNGTRFICLAELEYRDLDIQPSH